MTGFVVQGHIWSLVEISSCCCDEHKLCPLKVSSEENYILETQETLYSTVSWLFEKQKMGFEE